MSARLPSVRRLFAVCLALVAALLTACSTPAKRQEYVTPNDVWEGRLSVQVAGDPPQRISADFFLEGTARRASLTLNSPLGTRMARMQWDATSATLELGDQKRSLRESFFGRQ